MAIGSRIFSRQDQKEDYILELTVCFEGAYTAGQKGKAARYLELASEVGGNDYNVELITLEVGSQGLVCIDRFQHLGYHMHPIIQVETVPPECCLCSHQWIIQDLDNLEQVQGKQVVYRYRANSQQ